MSFHRGMGCHESLVVIVDVVSFKVSSENNQVTFGAATLYRNPWSMRKI